MVAMIRGDRKKVATTLARNPRTDADKEDEAHVGLRLHAVAHLHVAIT
jgi:hypothetical protein